MQYSISPPTPTPPTILFIYLFIIDSDLVKS